MSYVIGFILGFVTCVILIRWAIRVKYGGLLEIMTDAYNEAVREVYKRRSEEAQDE